jgi:hypothetical protein
MSELPQVAPAVAASLDLKNSSFESASLARWYTSPNTGANTASEAACVKMVPRAMAEGFTGGRSGRLVLKRDEREEREELRMIKLSFVLCFDSSEDMPTSNGKVCRLSSSSPQLMTQRLNSGV